MAEENPQIANKPLPEFLKPGAAYLVPKGMDPRIARPVARAPSTPSTLPTDSESRKGVPVLRGFFRYFPAAIAGAARWSKLGNDKHNPGEQLHHARGKSNDHGDCVLRHIMDIQDIEAAFARQPAHLNEAEVSRLLDEADAMFWRAGALSQEIHEKYGGAPLAPAAKVTP
jgi:hypothetical protein